MENTKKSKPFCNTSYKKWLALLGVMTVVLVVWVSLGFNEDKAQANLDRFSKLKGLEGRLENNKKEENVGHDGSIQLSKLQNSYSDIAAKVKEITVNISATNTNFNVNTGQDNLNFADPFGTQPPQQPPAEGQNPPSAPSAIGVGVVQPMAPPITANAKMPHPYRGVCTNCHKIIPGPASKKIAAQTQQSGSVGSGLIVDPSGYILSNYHIIESANDIIVQTSNGNRYRAEVKYTDVPGDLAILKINSAAALPAATFGDSDLIQEGDIVLAVGSPFGLNLTVTSGIISSASRTVSIGGKQFAGLIQTDAAINRGSSGGPLVNIKGEVIGINTAIYSMTGDFTGVGFAIPINRAKETFLSVPAISALAVNFVDMNVGEIITVAMGPNGPDAWFGVEVATLDTIMADQLGLNDVNGVLVNRVFVDSPAEKAGLKRGDVILKINGRNTMDVKKFQKITSLLKPGEAINLITKRNAESIAMAAMLESGTNRKIPAKEAGAIGAGPAQMEWAGMEVVPITPQLAKKYGIQKGLKGVMVLEAEGMGAAAGIMNGDVILGLNRKKIANMADFASATSNANTTEGVLFDISRQGDPLYITM